MPLQDKRATMGENTTMMINGTPVNDPETGKVIYSTWGGLNDAMRNTVNTIGLAATENTFGTLGGTSSIITRASQFSPGTRITYSAANRNYRHRAMFIHSTGLKDDAWALTISGSRRWAQEGYIENFYEDTPTSFRWKGSLAIIFRVHCFGSPCAAAGGIAVQEAYD